MSLTITSHVSSGSVVLNLSGRLCFMEMALREQITAFLSEGQREFVLNMAELSHIDSFGLGQLVAIWTSIRNKNGHMKLVQPGEKVRKLLDITKLDTVFQIESEQTASEASRT
jgi:anti-sigma B factor antagonist